MDECVPQAEARLAAKRAARAEAREIRMKELERQQKEVSALILKSALVGVIDPTADWITDQSVRTGQSS